MKLVALEPNPSSSRLMVWKRRLGKSIALVQGGFQSLAVQMSPNVTIQLPLSAHRQYWQGVHDDASLLQFLAQAIPDAGVYFDIGANIGIYDAALWAMKAGQIKLVAFEPVASTIAILKEVLALNQVNAQVEPVALSSESGALILSAYGDGANNFWIKEDENQNLPTTSVPKMTLDEWCSQHPDYSPHAIKIDVEGHELDVLKGAQHTLRTHKPTLVVECHCASWDDLEVSRQEFTDLINSLGYRRASDPQGNAINFLNQSSTVHLLCSQ